MSIKSFLHWFIYDDNGEKVSIHQSDGSGALRPDLVRNGIEYETEGQIKIAKEQAVASAYWSQKFAEMDAQEAQATAEREAREDAADRDVDGTQIGCGWF